MDGYLDYTHFEVIGACLFFKCSWHGCVTTPTPELSEYLPDLVVTSYSGEGNDPWEEVSDTLDPVADAAGNASVASLTGFPLTNDHSAMITTGMALASNMARSVDVIGNPAALFEDPFPHLHVDTDAYEPYYQSALDAIMDRSGMAEALEPMTFSPTGDYIGHSFVDHWSYEFPRTMVVDVDNPYKAALIAAQHAADMVTNKNTLHVIHSVDDSCGKNCAVANVIQETSDTHEIWQEVYPSDHHVVPGQDDTLDPTSLGSGDEAKGNDNYVFVIWRHYKGCVQAPGKLIYATVTVPPTTKR